MMTESEVLEKLKKFKEAIQNKNSEILKLKELLRIREEELKKYNPNWTDVPSNGNLLSSSFKNSEIVLTSTSKPKFENDNKPKNYVFARATKETASKLEKFIKKCISDTEAGKAFIAQPETGAIYADISVKTKETFLNILLTKSLNGKKLALKVKDKYYANFTSKEICDYLLQETE